VSLSEILGSALSGLTAAQAGLRAVSTNVANATTPGYARQRVSLTPQVLGGRSVGVVVGEPQRVADRFLETTVYRRSGDVGRAEAEATYLDRLQTLMGEPGSSAGLPARLNAISSSAIDMASLKASPQSVAVFTGRVQDALDSLKQLDSDVQNIRSEVGAEIGSSVERINSLLVRIYDLNDSIATVTGLGKGTSGAADQRLQAVDELSSLVKVTVRDQVDGRVTIETASGAALLDGRLRQLSYPAAGASAGQTIYPPIDIRFADKLGQPGASTGEVIDTSAVGGRLGGLIDLRDRALPAFSSKVGTLFTGMAEALNAVSNARSAVPPPQSLVGHTTALDAGDRLGFTGSAVFAVVQADGTLTARTQVDFTALGAGATVTDAVNAINAGLGASATATFANGKLTITAASAGAGIAVAQDPAAPSDRAGVGFSQFFGLNDLIEGGTGVLAPTGFNASDPTGFTAGQTTQLVLRDVTGRRLAEQTLTATAGATFGNLITDLNSGPLSAYGSFALDNRGRVAFTPLPSVLGSTVSIVADSTDRLGTGRTFSEISGLGGGTRSLATANVRDIILNDPAQLALAKFDTTAAIGSKALGKGDFSGALDFGDQMSKAIDLGANGTLSMETFASRILGGAGTDASRANDRLADMTARRDDAVNRRDNFSGVNIDEELSLMVVLQNSYAASARVVSTANAMYDTLLGMVG